MSLTGQNEGTDSYYDAWVHEFDTFEFAQEKGRQRRDLHRFFDMAFALAQRFDDENVMQYALRRVETEIVKAANWEVLAAYLMRCVNAYPNTIPPCVAITETYHRYLQPAIFDAKRWSTLIPAQVAHFAALERHSEVAWLLWLALRIGTKLDRAAVEALEGMSSSVCLVLALALESRGQLRKRLARKRLPYHRGSDALYVQTGSLRTKVPFKDGSKRRKRWFEKTVISRNSSHGTSVSLTQIASQNHYSQ